MTKTYDQTTGELCEKCGWSMKFPDEPCRCELERENAALREAKDAYFKHNNILVELMTEEQRKKALEILISQPKETQP